MNIIEKFIRKVETKRLRRELLKKCNTPKQLNLSHRDVNIIASLTSYPARFKDLHIVLESIFQQTVLPDKIILYLDNNVKETDIPENIVKLKQYGLSIIIGGDNIKPHKKYFYAMKDNPDSIIITFDDDNMYRKDTIEKLLKSYYKHPSEVSCLRAHRMKFDTEHNILPYLQWDLICTDEIDKPSAELLATGVGGVLYPPHCMIDEAFNLDNIKGLCIGADDIWLKYMQLLSGKRVVAVEHKKRLANPLPTDTTTVSALGFANVGESVNDKYITNLERFYKRKLYDLCKECEK